MGGNYIRGFAGGLQSSIRVPYGRGPPRTTGQNTPPHETRGPLGWGLKGGWPPGARVRWNQLEARSARGGGGREGGGGESLRTGLMVVC